jgi:toxin CcdB
MSDFTVHENLSSTRDNYPYLLDIQSSLLENLQTRLVIPLMRKSQISTSIIRNLNLIVIINNEEHVAMTQQMAAIPKAVLGPISANSRFSRTEVLIAVDLLITGI